MVFRKGFALALVCAATVAVSTASHGHENVHAQHKVRHTKQDDVSADDSSEWGASGSGDDDWDVSQDDTSMSQDESSDMSGDDLKFSLDGSASESFDWSTSMSQGEEIDASVDLEDGSMDLEMDDSEDLSEDVDLEDGQEMDELIKLPKGAKSVRLRVREGKVDLEILREAEGGKQTKTVANAPKSDAQESVVHKADSWASENAGTPTFIAAVVGAIAAAVGVAGVVIKRRQNAEFERSVLALDVAEQAKSETAVDEAAESSEEEEDEEEEEADSVVEGSV